MLGSSLKTKEWEWISFLVVAFVDEKDKKKGMSYDTPFFIIWMAL